METWVEDWHAYQAAKADLSLAIRQARAVGMTDSEIMDVVLLHLEDKGVPPEDMRAWLLQVGY